MLSAPEIPRSVLNAPRNTAAVAVTVLLAAVPAAAGTPDVDWDHGSGPPNMAKGLPNPPGWYRAAVGPRSPEKVLYLTFDDGPSPQTRPLLRSLRRHGAHATFFVVGAAAAAAPGVLSVMRRDGHAIGNHTWSHPRLTDVPTAVVRREIRRTRRAVGPGGAPCLRPPFGLVDERVAHEALRQGLMPVVWTAHVEDWNPHPLSWTVARLRAATRPGAVILMHDTHRQTVHAVRTMLPRWRARGYRLDVVPACKTPTS